MTYDGTPSRHRTVRASRLTCLVRARGGGTAGERVQRHLVVRHEVDAFNDVDLAVVRPVVAFRPYAWPDLLDCVF